MKKKLKNSLIGLTCFASLLGFLYCISTLRFNNWQHDIIYGVCAIVCFIIFGFIVKKFGKE